MDATQLPGSQMVIGAVDATRVRNLVETVVDPEIPVLTIEELGILRDVRVEDGTVLVEITPTYSGCPAMDQISDDVGRALTEGGIDDFEVRLVQSPAWTTDWISEEARSKLADFGIAPPGSPSLCPSCDASKSRMVSLFGSTACKALMVCTGCGEPFDYFKEY